MTTIHEILTQVGSTTKKTEKEAILKEHDDHPFLKSVLGFAYNPYEVFHVVKVPEVTDRGGGLGETSQWNSFFSLLDRLSSREVTGHAAIDAVHSLFSICSEENEGWMRRVLDRHLNIGITSSTINKAFPMLIPTFKVQLSKNYEPKRVEGMDKVVVEPKMDGNRCVAIVRNGACTLYSRNGLIIEGFEETISAELAQLDDVCDGVYDGEIFGKNFKAVMKQIRKKKNSDVSGLYFIVWDWMPVEDWDQQKTDLTCTKSREYLELLDIGNCQYVKLIRRDIIHPSKVDEYMDMYFEQEITDEGIMVKVPDACYKFGRGFNIMKHKVFHTVDLPIDGFEKGKPGSKLANTLGKIFVTYNGVRVGVGSGFDDDERDEIYNNQEKYLGKISEIKYQSVTDDGSLRHPVFECLRPDKEER